MSVPPGRYSIEIPISRSSNTLPLFKYVASFVSIRCSNTAVHANPSFAATAAVCRTWFDCTAPCVTKWSAPRAKASPAKYSSFRTLFPPPPIPVKSSRLIQISGPPKARVKFGSNSKGVGA